MAQFNFAEKSEIEELHIEPTDVMTGDKNKSRYLLYQLKLSMARAKQIDIIVSFLMESGVRMLLSDLKAALQRGVRIRILTGNYLGITQPSALYLLKKELGDKVELHFYSDKGRSFHPKSYIFHYDNMNEIYIGSSNISRSALTSGIEWNYRFNNNQDSQNFNLFYETFEDLFKNHSYVINDAELKEYSKNWHKPAVAKDLARYDQVDPDTKVEMLFQPRGAQIEALCALENSRAEGAVRGLVHAATGVGKTYLAAFDSAKYERVLFVAHREEILKQAAVSFKNVRHSDDYGFFDGKQKDTGKSVIFASVATLGRSEYLTEEYFAPDYFTYLVIDEFHHAVTDQYQRIVNYFKPQFMLGLTATPERMDGKSIYEICDYNVPYEITLKEAINKGALVPFHYYGIYDESVNYDKVEYKNGKYNEKELEKALSINNRAELILKHYKKYKSTRALGFCTSKSHAEFMAKYFNENGVPSCAVYSSNEGEYNEERSIALKKLRDEDINVIFSVDMFNEGIDMVMFLRPTESPTVFLQQLGRGLRKDKNKKYLNVLDFIGNFKKANLVPYLLTGESKIRESNTTTIPSEEDYPEDCFIDFDFRLIDIFDRIKKATQKIEDKIVEEFFRIKEYLGHTPSRTDMFTYMDEDLYINIKKKSKLNIFRDYISFLVKINEYEDTLKDTLGHEFIKFIETTSMSKTYKLPVLLAFYNNGNMKLKINDEDLYKSFKEFYSKGSNGVDMLKDKSTSKFKTWDKKEYVKLARKNPVHFLCKSSSEFFYLDGDYICLNKELEKFFNNEEFINSVKDAIDFRTKEYYKNRFEHK